MKEIDTRRLKDVLRRQFGFTRGPGGMTGHETWVDDEGRKITPVLRHKTVPYAGLFCLGQQLEAQGVCSRMDFLRTFRSCCNG